MKRVFRMIIVAILLGTASVAYAAAPYYEFQPDYSQSLLVASSDTLSEVFLPLNEFLSGYDLWVSNDGQAGDATFTFYGPSGNQIAERTVTVPAIADGESGTRLHVNLSSQVAVSGTGIYRIAVASAVPTLRLYYADQNQLLAHNASPWQMYSGGRARIGQEDKNFSFLFALYENHETAPPVVSGVATTQTDIDHVILTFNANEPVDAHVAYGTSTVDWTGTYTGCLPGVLQCTVTLPVTPDTAYTYTLTARDVWGNESAFTGTFTSLGYGQTPPPTPTAVPSASATPAPSASATPDTVPPVITNPHTANMTPHSAGFAWTTDEAANSTVAVRLTPVLITAGGNSDSTQELEHYVTVGNLTPDTHYQATITSADGSGNTGSAVITFLTPKEVATTPVPSSTPQTSGTPTLTPVITPAPQISVGPSANADGSTVVSWQAPAAGEPSDGYRVDVFDQNNHLITTIRVPAGTHQASLPNLPNGQQRIVVYTDNAGTYQKVAAPSTVRIGSQPASERLLSSAPYILGGIVAAIALAIVVLKLRRPRPPVLPPPSTTPLTPSV